MNSPLDDLIDELLMVIGCSEATTPFGLKYNINRFDGALAYTADIALKMAQLSDSADYIDNARLCDLDTNLNFSFITEMINADWTDDIRKEWGEDRFARSYMTWVENGGMRSVPLLLVQTRSLNPQQLRGGRMRYHSRPIECSFLRIERATGFATGWDRIVGYDGVSQCRYLSRRFDNRIRRDSFCSEWIDHAIRLQWSARYKWSVRLNFEGNLAVSFWTDPHGAKEAFRLRDIPNGKTRREALRHWVREHWRQKRESDGVALVREHLRGQTKFSWNGLRCEIKPSAFDLEKAIAK